MKPPRLTNYEQLKRPKTNKVDSPRKVNAAKSTVADNIQNITNRAMADIKTTDDSSLLIKKLGNKLIGTEALQRREQRMYRTQVNNMTVESD